MTAPTARKSSSKPDRLSVKPLFRSQTDGASVDTIKIPRGNCPGIWKKAAFAAFFFCICRLGNVAHMKISDDAPRAAVLFLRFSNLSFVILRWFSYICTTLREKLCCFSQKSVESMALLSKIRYNSSRIRKTASNNSRRNSKRRQIGQQRGCNQIPHAPQTDVSAVHADCVQAGLG